MPSSSSSSRISAAPGGSLGSTFPPRNSHLSGCWPVRLRWAINTSPARSMTPATTVVIIQRESSLYSEVFLDHFRNPRNVGELAPPAVTVEISNPACGDILRLSARFEDGRVTEARYKVRGCTASIASGSALTEWMLGKSRVELAALTAGQIESAVGGLIPESKHAAVLCLDGIKALLKAQ